MFLLMQELYASVECVYHVSERVFTIYPVYTEGWFTPAGRLRSSVTNEAGVNHLPNLLICER